MNSRTAEEKNNTMSDGRIGLRAITMQQPFAAAMVAGQGLYTRRGKATAFDSAGEWVAVHCGQNDEHLKNAALMEQVRIRWPACPSEEELRGQQKCLLGVARFIDGDVSASTAEKTDFFLAHYDCCKPVAWRADMARAACVPVSYPKGNLQVWHLKSNGFTNGPADAEAILALTGRTFDDGKAVNGSAKEDKVKVEEPEQQARKGSTQRAAPWLDAAVKTESVKEDEDEKAPAPKRVKKELAGLGPMQTYRPKHRGATVTAFKSSGPPAPRNPAHLM